ncbi:hypothetical protein [Amaricoccus solimangrovi]|uniref:Recombinase RecT n=1 Tax=Amaricoccus solimangrovi TaxID=2589815 RepID=A0A501WWF1_9RHOB|nr:hypothetical protein [Amaricoccus solimangrovi]TPE53052.1 hypothetical protein FJM51_03230 [Amaricoccus solimangrovi]
MNQTTAISTQTAPAPAKAPVKAGGAIAAFAPQTIEEAFRLSQALAGAGDMVPKAFQNRPEMIMAAIMKGSEVGLAPMQALAHIAVVNGRPSLWGDAIPGLVMRAGHHVDVEISGEGEKMVATATLTRGDNGRVIVRTFSMADAKRAGLAGKQGPWQQYPARMLSMRARSFAVRDGAPDALMGLELTEEVQDYGPDRARDVTPATPRRGGVIYRDEPAPQPADEIIEHNADGEVVEGAPTPEQIEAAMAAAKAEAERQARDEDEG